MLFNIEKSGLSKYVYAMLGLILLLFILAPLSKEHCLPPFFRVIIYSIVLITLQIVLSLKDKGRGEVSVEHSGSKFTVKGSFFLIIIIVFLVFDIKVASSACSTFTTKMSFIVEPDSAIEDGILPNDLEINCVSPTRSDVKRLGADRIVTFDDLKIGDSIQLKALSTEKVYIKNKDHLVSVNSTVTLKLGLIFPKKVLIHVNDGDKPIEGVDIRIKSAQYRTDSTGTVVVYISDELKKSTWNLYLSKSGYHTRKALLNPHLKDEFDLILEKD